MTGPHPAGTAFCRRLLITVCAGFAGTTALTHAALFLEIPYRLYAGASLLVLAVCCTAAWRAARPEQEVDRDRFAPALLAVLSVFGACIALFAHKTAADDCYYVPNAVHALQNPGAPMGFRIHYLYGGAETFTSYVWGTAFPFEYLLSVFAWLTGLQYLTVYHLIAPAVMAPLIPLALFFLISRFVANSRHAALGTLFSVLLLLLLGESLRTFGNMSFIRMFEGKTVLLAVGIPFFCALSVDYLGKPSIKGWWMLFITATALAGLSSSAMILLPPLAAALYCGQLAAAYPRVRPLPRLALTYVATLAYPLLCAVVIATLPGTRGDAYNVITAGYPTTFSGHLLFLTDPGQPVTPVTVVLCIGLALFVTRGWRRRFIAGWLGGAVLLFLNPLTAPPIIAHVTSAGIYWRLFYLLPFPLAAGVAAAELYQRLSVRLSVRPLSGVLAGVLVVLILPHFFTGSSSVFRDKVTFGWPHYKLPDGFYDEAAQVAKKAPDGPMLAPSVTACLVSMIDAGHPQYRIRSAGIRLFMARRGTPELADLRMQASDFTGGNVSRFPAFQQLLETDPPRTIVMVTSLSQSPPVRALLARHGFAHSEPIGNLTLFWKT